ncbi:hypothetical protein [Streptomyces sp. NPDC088766]|uniref:hypothetical protein n=1 Tax=Streptomyces sp. NPDC088766 TaxID=3365893 RepID=UPI0037F47D18
MRPLGLTRAFLTPHEPAERRLPVPERDDGAFGPHAHEQPTAACRHAGDDRAARPVPPAAGPGDAEQPVHAVERGPFPPSLGDDEV